MNATPSRTRRAVAWRPAAARVALCLVIAGAAIWIFRAEWFLVIAPASDFADADNSELVAQGAALYREHCASCHGANLEGQPNWQTVAANGRFPAPPQDHRGHSWMHSDAELLRTIEVSLRDTAPPGYVTDMPAFEGVLSEQQMMAVLAFIKSHWPLGVRAYQSVLNPDRQGMPKAVADADWSFPIDCGHEPQRARAPTK
jgi:mono/diheme cytochrome c family protein